MVIYMLNFYFRFILHKRLELTRRLKHRKNAQQNGASEFSSDSSSSDSESSSSDSSDSSSDSEIEENGENGFSVINDALEQPAKIAETVSC